jgi:hypothetical protein
MSCTKRNEWLELRTEYYVAGRTLHISGNYKMSGIMLGYAIETSLKHALCETGFTNTVILHKHDILLLMETCITRNILANVKVTKDFLTYVNDYFMPRYPSLLEKVVENTKVDDRFLLRSIDFLPYYDDLMIQIDDEIATYSGDKKCTIGVRALSKILEFSGRAFFHCNYPACLRLDKYRTVIESLQPEKDLLTEMNKGIDHLWDCNLMYQHTHRNTTITADWHPSSKFEYPKWQTLNGVKYIKLRLPIASDLSGISEFVPD